MERLASGELPFDDTFPVSRKAWRMGGSRTFIDVNSDVRIEDLLKGIIIQSGNDASVAVAEGIAGSEEAFATLMTAKASELGMSNTVFTNSSGWPDPNLVTTVRDLSTLAIAMIRNFPQYYHLYSEREFTYNNIRQYSRNPILGRVEGADGIKTGHTNAAGYGLIGSAIRDGRRVVMVMGGFKTAKARAQETRRVMDAAFREFSNVTVYKQGDIITELPVWLGKERTLTLKADYDYTVTLPRAESLQVKAHIDLPAHLDAPIMAGEPVGRVVLRNNKNEEIHSFTVTSPLSVERVGAIGALRQRIGLLMNGKIM
jgi:D-alanyl-D-alanine carboxypeptidase (penicillin-binding protein 5/6)